MSSHDSLEKYPPSPWHTVLEKAKNDTFSYLLRLSTGEIIHFVSAQEHGEYISLSGCRIIAPPELVHARFDRGMDIHKDAIVWVADNGFIEGV